jgi:hypothetical protein
MSSSKNCTFRSLAIGNPSIPKPKFTDSIESHARWIFEHIYLYQKKKLEIHGTLHASRVSQAIPLLHKIYLGADLSLSPLSENQLKLAQLAGLFHDMARLHDGEDIWDLESGASAYYYLQNMPGLPATDYPFLIAYLIANKDEANSDHTWRILEDVPTETSGAGAGSGTSTTLQKDMTFERGTPLTDQAVLLMRDCLHDADCLDIMRCNSGLAFDSRYLRLYERYSDHIHPHEFAWVRDAWFELIHFQGDLTWLSNTLSLKQYQEQIDCFEKVSADLVRLNADGTPKFPLLFLLKTGGSRAVPKQLLDSEIETKSDPRSQEMRNKGLIGRFMHYAGSRNFLKDVHTELRYAGTRGEDGRVIGNLNRCGSLLGKGVIPLGPIGFLIKPSVKVHQASLNDIDSGWGDTVSRLSGNITGISQLLKSTSHHKTGPKDDSLPQSALSETGHTSLLGHLKLEAELKFPSYPQNRAYILRHTEIHFDYGLEDIEGILYSTELIRNISEETMASPAIHEWSVRIRAYFLQEATTIACGRELPIYQYSGLTGQIKLSTITPATLLAETLSILDFNIENDRILLNFLQKFKTETAWANELIVNIQRYIREKSDALGPIALSPEEIKNLKSEDPALAEAAAEAFFKKHPYFAYQTLAADADIYGSLITYLSKDKKDPESYRSNLPYRFKCLQALYPRLSPTDKKKVEALAVASLKEPRSFYYSLSPLLKLMSAFEPQAFQRGLLLTTFYGEIKYGENEENKHTVAELFSTLDPHHPLHRLIKLTLERLALEIKNYQGKRTIFELLDRSQLPLFFPDINEFKQPYEDFNAYNITQFCTSVKNMTLFLLTLFDPEACGEVILREYQSFCIARTEKLKAGSWYWQKSGSLELFEILSLFSFLTPKQQKELFAQPDVQMGKLAVCSPKVLSLLTGFEALFYYVQFPMIFSREEVLDIKAKMEQSLQAGTEKVKSFLETAQPKTQAAILSKQTHLHEEVAKLIEQVEKTLAKEAVSSTFTTPLRAFGEMGGAGAGGPGVAPEVD